MADAALRTRALSLYRSLMRSSRTWPGPPKEKQYIYEEAYILFRRNQHLNDPDEIAKKVYSNSKHPLLKLCMLSLYIAIDPVSYRFLAQ